MAKRKLVTRQRATGLAAMDAWEKLIETFAHDTAYVRALTFDREPALNILRAAGWAKLSKDHMKAHPSCAHCRRAHRLNVPHHIFPVHLFPQVELNPANLLTLCPPCHLYIGHGGNWRWYNKNLVWSVEMLSSGIVRDK